ncbi:MAG: 3-phosphoshikimate 1-carboxyvinyltransferase, partial [Marinirhabdus sp.]
YFKNSLQGDSALVSIYKKLGVSTIFNTEGGTISLSKNNLRLKKEHHFNLKNTPDIAQTLAVSCFGLGAGCRLTGLHTLKIKETDRLLALATELTKLGAAVTVTQNSLELQPSKKIVPNTAIATYNDHRMAMAFAPLAQKVPLTVMGASVVSKSFPNFWAAMAKAGLQVTQK